MAAIGHVPLDLAKVPQGFAQIAAQRRPMREDLIQKTIMSLIPHGWRGYSWPRMIPTSL
jgi:hypothetical protein